MELVILLRFIPSFPSCHIQINFSKKVFTIAYGCYLTKYNKIIWKQNEKNKGIKIQIQKEKKKAKWKKYKYKLKRKIKEKLIPNFLQHFELCGKTNFKTKRLEKYILSTDSIYTDITPLTHYVVHIPNP